MRASTVSRDGLPVRQEPQRPDVASQERRAFQLGAAYRDHRVLPQDAELRVLRDLDADRLARTRELQGAEARRAVRPTPEPPDEVCWKALPRAQPQSMAPPMQVEPEQPEAGLQELVQAVRPEQPDAQENQQAAPVPLEQLLKVAEPMESRDGERLAAWQLAAQQPPLASMVEEEPQRRAAHWVSPPEMAEPQAQQQWAEALVSALARISLLLQPLQRPQHHESACAPVPRDRDRANSSASSFP